MLEFTKNAFNGFMGFILWINLILFTVGSGIIGNLIARRGDNTGYIIGDVFIGIVIGLLSNIIFGGFIATILNINKKLEYIDTRLENINENFEIVYHDEIFDNNEESSDKKISKKESSEED